MADTAFTTGTEDETPGQRQARLRREKMKKKMADQGEDRLNRIKALNGGVAPPVEMLGGPTNPNAQPTAPTYHAKQASVGDPDEVDIDILSGAGTPSQFQPRQGGAGAAQNDPFAAAMQQQQGQGGGGGGGGEEDPITKMMQQFMGGGGGNPQDPNNPQPDIPAMMQAMLGGGGSKQTPNSKTSSTAYPWRITHALFALTLALYITLTSPLPFDGSKLSRSHIFSIEAENVGPRLFWLFATAELGLQSVRYFLEKGQLQGGGMLATVANSGFVPEPYANYVRVLGRYVGIFQTIVADAMVVVFVFGVLAWWQGAVER